MSGINSIMKNRASNHCHHPRPLIVPQNLLALKTHKNRTLTHFTEKLNLRCPSQTSKHPGSFYHPLTKEPPFRTSNRSHCLCQAFDPSSQLQMQSLCIAHSKLSLHEIKKQSLEFLDTSNYRANAEQSVRNRRGTRPLLSCHQISNPPMQHQGVPSAVRCGSGSMQFNNCVSCSKRHVSRVAAGSNFDITNSCGNDMNLVSPVPDNLPLRQSHNCPRTLHPSGGHHFRDHCIYCPDRGSILEVPSQSRNNKPSLLEQSRNASPHHQYLSREINRHIQALSRNQNANFPGNDQQIPHVLTPSHNSLPQSLTRANFPADSLARPNLFSNPQIQIQSPQASPFSNKCPLPSCYRGLKDTLLIPPADPTSIPINPLAHRHPQSAENLCEPNSRPPNREALKERLRKLILVPRHSKTPEKSPINSKKSIFSNMKKDQCRESPDNCHEFIAIEGIESGDDGKGPEGQAKADQFLPPRCSFFGNVAKQIVLQKAEESYVAMINKKKKHRTLRKFTIGILLYYYMRWPRQ